MSNRFKAKFNIKKGDQVVVIAGADKDLKKHRTVLAVYPDDAKVLVEGVNVKKRHTKPNAQYTQGGIIEKEAPIHISNVMLWDAKAGSGSRVKRSHQDGKLVRTSKKSGEVI